MYILLLAICCVSLVNADHTLINHKWGRRRRAPVIKPCPAGEVGPGNGNCAACTRGKYLKESERKDFSSVCKLCQAGQGSEAPFTDCTDCKPGQYSVGGDSPGCKFCDSGKYQNDQGHVDCDKCDGGKYMNEVGGKSCKGCSSGKYAESIGAKKCHDCPAGYSQNSIDETFCEECQKGKFSSETGQIKCKKCELGKFGADVGKIKCEKCAKGTYQPNTQATDCEACETGRRSSVEGAHACSPCPAGTSQKIEKQQSCDYCVKGQFNADTGKAYCKNCDSGQSSSLDGSLKCTLCEKGTSQSDPGQESCKDCVKGWYQKDTGSESCSRCKPGFFSENDKAITCKQCVAGKYQSNVRGEICIACAKGRSAPKKASKNCDDCPIGRSQNEVAKETCKECVAGTYAAGLRNEICSDCSSGQSSDIGAAACTVCAAGKFQAVAGSGICQSCPLGRFQPAQASSVCFACGAGFYGDSLGLTICKQCIEGTFNKDEGQLSCTPCAGGQISFPAAMQCIDCVAGRQSQNGQCLECNKGKYSNTGADACVNCDGGSYTSQIGQSACGICPTGFSSSLGAEVCGPCIAGKIAGVGSTTCASCPQGQNQPNEREDVCISCEIGKSQPNEGKNKCNECVPGQAQSTVGQTACIKCKSGMYTTTTASLSCDLCGIGKFADNEGFSDCKLCAVGTFSKTKGSSTCTSCSTGQIVNVVQGICLPCIAGKYNNAAGATECKSCEAGKFGTTDGMSSCDDCSIGQYSSDKGYFICKLCETGMYAGSVGAVICKECEAGKFNPTKGTAACTECAQGSFSFPTAAHTECQLCLVGYAAISTGLTECSECDSGTVARFIASSACTPCNIGTYALNTASQACELCPEGTHASVEGTSTCTLCDEGKFGYAKGLANCRDCVAGRVADSKGSQSCIACEAGRAGTDIPRIACTDCQGGPDGIGTYQDKAGQGECELCGKATVAKSTECTDEKCSAGQFKDGIVCKPCIVGRHQDQRDQTVCKTCVIGFYSGPNQIVTYTAIDGEQTTTTFGADLCISCADGKFGMLPGKETEVLACTECSAGRWNSGEGYDASTNPPPCNACPKGRYTSETGRTDETQCKYCSPGKYNDQQGSTNANFCIKCGTGKYSIEVGAISLDRCINCEKGEFQTKEGSTSCSICAAGQYSVSAGKAVCTKCSKGYYNNEIGQDSCKLAPSGSYATGWETGRRRRSLVSDLISESQEEEKETKDKHMNERRLAQYEGATSKSDARVGTRLINCVNEPNTPNSAGCSTVEACPQGWMGTTPPTGVCETCPAGTRSDEGSGECMECGEGSYTKSSGSGVCLTCPPGKASTNTISNICLVCGPGQYSPGEKEKVCLECNIGQYSSNDNIDPAVGETISGAGDGKVGNDRCTVCPEGYVQPLPKQNECTSCEEGKRQVALQICEECSKGAYQPDEAKKECLTCPDGWVQPIVNGVSCTECLAGSYMVSTQIICEVCTLGQFQPEAGTSGCIRCDPGKVQKEEGESTCDECEAGFFAPKQGLTVCDSCIAGFFADAKISAICTTCPQGWVQENREALDCLKCGVGKYQWEQVCEKCSTGQYSTEEAVYEKCTDCPAGYIQIELEASSCDECEKGQYVSSRGQQDCLECEQGKFTNNTKSSICEDCPRGFVQYETGKLDCIVCETGQQSNEETNQCDDCLAGQFAATKGLEECTDCPGGWMNNDGWVLKDKCKICPSGYHANIDAVATSCKECPVGWSGPDVGKIDCIGCPSGWFQENPRSPLCEPCPAGTEAPSDFLATQCDSCKAGYFAPTVGSYNDNRKMQQDSKGCRICPSGWMVPHKGTKTCESCETGQKVTSVLVPINCEECDTGRYTNMTGSIECNGCPIGWAQDNEGMGKCSTCLKGTFSTTTDATDLVTIAATHCFECPLGFYQSADVSARCIECPSGFFQKEISSKKCLVCPSGYETDHTRKLRDKCAGCKGGQYSKCEICKYSEDNYAIYNKRTNIYRCPDGWIEDVRYPEISSYGILCSKTGKIPSKSRREANKNRKILTCTDCPKGKYQSNDHEISCIDCAPGFFSQAGQKKCIEQPKDTEMSIPRLKSLVPQERSINKLILTFYLNKQDYFGIGTTTDTKRDGGGHFAKQGIIFQWSNVDSVTNFPDLNARDKWEKLSCGETKETKLPGTETYMDSLHFFCLTAEYMELPDVGNPPVHYQQELNEKWQDRKKKYKDRNNITREVSDDEDIEIEILITTFQTGPVWNNPIYLRAAFFTSTGTTSTWTRKYGGTTTTDDCANSESRQEYLRTYPDDNTCENPLNLLDIDNNSSSTSESDQIQCIECPPGGNCLTQDKTLTAGPKYAPKLGMMNPMDRFDVGSHSGPVLGDLDGDGDIDMLVGSSTGAVFYFINNGNCRDKKYINWYSCMNAGQLWVTSYAETDAGNNPMHEFNVGSKGKLSLADLDNDGDLDLVVGNGEVNLKSSITNTLKKNTGWSKDVDDGGEILYYENIGNPNRPVFVERLGTENPMNNIDMGTSASPTLIDINGDGKIDMFVGKQDGTIAYYNNTGSMTQPNFTNVRGSDNPINGYTVKGFASPALEDIDGDGDFDLLVGNAEGFIAYFENTGSVNSPEFMPSKGSLNPIDDVDAGSYISLALKDLDGDGDIDLFVGSMYGKFKYYKNMAVPKSLAGTFIPRPGMFVWDIGKLENYWRIPWAPMQGERKNSDGELVPGPLWFHPCPRKNTCYGVSKKNRMWGSLNPNRNTLDQQTTDDNDDMMPKSCSNKKIATMDKCLNETLYKWHNRTCLDNRGSRIDIRSETACLNQTKYQWTSSPRSSRDSSKYMDGAENNQNSSEFIGGWNNNMEDNEARYWSCPQNHPAPRCKEGTNGPLCAICIEDWIRIQGECRKCFAIATRIALLLGVIFGGVIISIFLMKLISKCGKFHNAFRDAVRISVVGLNLAQIMSAAKTVIPVPWPPTLIWFFEQLDFVNFDITSLTGATCNKEVNFVVQFVAMASIPIIVVVVICFRFCKGKIAVRKRLRHLRIHKERQDVAIQKCYTELFDIIDGNGDESVDAMELIDLLKLVGYHRSVKQKVEMHDCEVLIQKLCNSRFATKLSRERFITMMMNGTLATQLDLISHDVVDAKHDPSTKHNLLHDGFKTVAWNEQRKLVVSHLSLGMHALMLLHAPVSRKVFQYFDCDLIGAEEWGRSFLRADYSIPCSMGAPIWTHLTPSYVLFLPVVFIVLVTFTIGLPLLLGGYFYLNRDNLYTPVVMIRIGWLYKRHPRNAEYWEIIELIRKMLLTGIVVFFPPNPVVRASFCMLICFMYTGTLNYIRPHKNNLVFWVEQLGYAAALLLFIAGVIFSETVDLDPKDAEVVGYFTIGLFLIFATLSMIAITLTILLLQHNIDVEIISPKPTLSKSKIQPTRPRKSASQHLQFAVKTKMLHDLLQTGETMKKENPEKEIQKREKDNLQPRSQVKLKKDVSLAMNALLFSDRGSRRTDSQEKNSDEDLMDGILEGKKTDNNKADSLRNDILGSIRKQQKQQLRSQVKLKEEVTLATNALRFSDRGSGGTGSQEKNSDEDLMDGILEGKKKRQQHSRFNDE